MLIPLIGILHPIAFAESLSIVLRVALVRFDGNFKVCLIWRFCSRPGSDVWGELNLGRGVVRCVILVGGVRVEYESVSLSEGEIWYGRSDMIQLP